MPVTVLFLSEEVLKRHFNDEKPGLSVGVAPHGSR